MADRGQPLLCADCGRPWAHLRDGRLWVYQRHNSEWHANSITPEEMVRHLYTLATEWYTLGTSAVYHNCVPFGDRERCEYSFMTGEFVCGRCGERWRPGDDAE